MESLQGGLRAALGTAGATRPSGLAQGRARLATGARTGGVGGLLANGQRNTSTRDEGPACSRGRRLSWAHRLCDTAAYAPLTRAKPGFSWGLPGEESREGLCVGIRLVTILIERSYLVDPASSHMLVSKIKPCMCKYELIQTVKLRIAH